jgi:DNA-binding CsgD family transcriptional regulator
MMPAGMESQAFREHLRSSLNLTARQIEIALLLAQGMRFKAVAHRLGCETSTITSHMADANKRAKVHGRSALICRLYQAYIEFAGVGAAA